jgi:acetylornithine deacetylase
MKEYIDLLGTMVQTPSLSFEEEAVAKVVCKALERFGMEFRLQRGNIFSINRHFDPSKPTLALDAHLDTVPAAVGYTRDPFDPGNDDSIIWGLGANDDGGSVVSMIAAFRHFYDMSLPINLMLILTREEERSGPDGARWIYSEEGPFAKEAAENKLPMPQWVIVGEPTGMRAAASERGLLVLDAKAHGVSAHAATGEGLNALYVALEDIEKLRAHKFTRVSPTMGEVRLNVTQIQAGTAHNVIPDLCTFVVDIRPTEMYSCEEILDELQALCQSELHARNLTNRSSATRPDSPLLEAAKATGRETFSSPTTSDWMRIGCDAIKMGPGDSKRSHKADEYLKVSELEEAIEVYIKYINAFCGIVGAGKGVQDDCRENVTKQ